MKQFVHIFAMAAFLGLPVQAQETDDGFSLMEEGARLLLRGIIQEMEPAMDGLHGLAEDMQPALREFVQEMGPAFADLMGKIDSLNAYHPPEILPNGDIILRRKTPQELKDEPQGEIEL